MPHKPININFIPYTEENKRKIAEGHRFSDDPKSTPIPGAKSPISFRP